MRGVSRYPFEMFDEAAKRTLVFAQEEAANSGAVHIGTEHLLLGILRNQEGVGLAALASLGVDPDELRRELRVTGGAQPAPGRQPIPTSRVKLSIEIAFEEARRMGCDHVTDGHILIGIAAEGEGMAAHVLHAMGADAPRVIAAVERELGVADQPALGDQPEPANIEALLSMLESVRLMLRHAVESRDTEHAIRLSGEESRLESELAKARRRQKGSRG